MKSLSKLSTVVAAFLLFSGCAHSELAPVVDAKEKAAIERDWIKNKSIKLAAYYPDKETMKRAQAIIDEKKIKEENVSEILYYSIDDGRHLLFFETDEHDGQARYHCIGLTKDRMPAVYWVQFQKRGEEMKIEAIEKPTESKVEQGGAGQPATRSESKPDGADKPQPESEGRSR